VPADRQRRRRRGGVRADFRRGDEGGGRPDDRARPPHDHGGLALSDTVFLVNPASANGKTGRRWPRIARAAHDAGLRGEAIFSGAPGELGGLAREAVDEGAKLLVVVGGDGTVHEVVNGIAGRDDVELALIPRGTGWDFARTHELPKSLGPALRIAKDGTAKPFDLGRATYRTAEGDHTAWFANIASVGMSGAVARRANDTTKALGGKASYAIALLAVFARWQNVPLRVSVDAASRDAVMDDVIVAVGRYLAGGMKITPDAKADDGLFDVLLIGDVTKAELVRVMPKLYRGTHLPHPKGELLRGASVTIEADEAMPVQLDGEQPGTTPARFEIVPNAIRLRVPG
jgi:diacylglycerol kinase (ATP)